MATEDRTPIVYTKPQCGQCDMTKMLMDKLDVKYRAVDISQDAEALALVKEMGYMSAPVIVSGDDHWSGFRPDKIKNLSAA